MGAGEDGATKTRLRYFAVLQTVDEFKNEVLKDKPKEEEVTPKTVA